MIIIFNEFVSFTLKSNQKLSVIFHVIMAGMAGYDQATNYQASSATATAASTLLSQQQYHPSGYLQAHQTTGNASPVASNASRTSPGNDHLSLSLTTSQQRPPHEQHLQHSQWHHHQEYQHHHLGQQANRYGPHYYDNRNGYYQTLESQNWHEPVRSADGGGSTNLGNNSNGGNSNRSCDSPISQQHSSYVTQPQTSQYPSGCKVATGPPSPQKTETTLQYPQTQYQCPITQYNNNIQPSATTPSSHHNTYSVNPSNSEASVGQGSPGLPSSNGGNITAAGSNQQNTHQSASVTAATQPTAPSSQGQLPSPLYPWMRSQFGKTVNNLFMHGFRTRYTFQNESVGVKLTHVIKR